MADDPSKAGGDAPPFTAEDALAFMQRMWNPFGMPMPGSTTGSAAPGDAPSAGRASTASPWSPQSMFAFPNPAAMFAALDPAEIDRRIGELRVIEGWLSMSLNMMQMTIRTLELQRTSLEALHAAQTPAKKSASKRKKS
ncbi:MAG TPA: PhaM family polyhydroxyalkanoate granule multifunctional regulatory protein [Casimicrobiaceae bacterium]|nr:PhaM family polyhydroxyalkanoate granule multifunctional regulatory protein [Casimicrobiaceae bacterium]